jgi:hypothetical protein
MDIEDVTDPGVGPEGTYTLLSTRMIGKTINEEKLDQNGVLTTTEQLKSICIFHEVAQAPTGVNPEDVKDVMHNINLPLPTDDQDTVKDKIRWLKRYMAVFNIPFTGSRLDLSKFLGNNAKCNLTQELYNDDLNNKIKLPNLK